MAYRFADDTAVTAAGDGFSATIHPEWSLFRPVGGYVAAIALRAAGEGLAFPPLSMSVDFAAAPKPGPAQVVVTEIVSRATAVCRQVDIRQVDRLVLSARFWAGADGPGLDHVAITAPAVALPRDAPSFAEIYERDSLARIYGRPTLVEALPLHGHVEERVLDWNSPDHWRARRPERKSWFRYAGYTPSACPVLEAARLLPLVDILPWYAAAMAHPPDTGFAGVTLHLDVTFHAAAPDSEWLLVEANSRHAARGSVHGAATAWAQDGRLLATATTTLVCRPLAAS